LGLKYQDLLRTKLTSYRYLEAKVMSHSHSRKLTLYRYLEAKVMSHSHSRVPLDLKYQDLFRTKLTSYRYLEAKVMSMGHK